MQKKLLNKSILILLSLTISTHVFGQLPTPSMVGYWESWKNLKLKNIDSRYNVVQISFAQGKNGKDYDLIFTNNYSDSVSGYNYIKTNPTDNDSLKQVAKLYNDSLFQAINDSVFKSEIQALQADGKKVLISLGGQNDQVMLDSIAEKEIFVSSVTDMIEYWGFDGLDIDLEGSSLSFNDIRIDGSGDPRIQYMIDGISQIMANYYALNGKKLLLTMAPETNYVQGGLSSWAVTNSHGGAYLPIIEALRDSIDMLNVQLYNSGSQYGIDNKIYKQGSADWILAMTEAVIKGFTGIGVIGDYSGLPANQVGVALPGCHSYDAVPHKEMEAAMRYLIGEGPQPGSYQIKPGGYPNLKGMMTWSINSDKGCNPSYGFVDTWSKVFTNDPYIEIKNSNDIYEDEEDAAVIQVDLFNDVFNSTIDSSMWEISNLPEGVEIDTIQRINDTVAEIILQGSSIKPYPRAVFNLTVKIDSMQLNSASKNISRNRGVVLKPKVSPIPGKLEMEKFIAHKGGKIGNISVADGGGLFARTNNNSWIELEVDVAQEDEYALNFRFRTSSGSHKISFKVDGVTKRIHTVKSYTGWLVWENSTFKTRLTSGKHTLKFQLTQGWGIFDWVNFSSTVGKEKITLLDKNLFYPNPASQSIFFKEASDLTIRIFGLKGQLVKETNLNLSNKIDISDLKTGVYTVQTKDSSGNIHYDKLVKK